ncbi:MAG: PASTA domain-containing protein [Treponemataceae bacterium]
MENKNFDEFDKNEFNEKKISKTGKKTLANAIDKANKAIKSMGKKTIKARSSFVSFLESLQNNGKSLLVLTIGVIILMGIFTVGIFLLTVKGSEEVMVPDVVGKELTEALLDMQIKELYPKLQLRYSSSPEDKGLVLEQSPTAGAIVKAGRRIELVVSRGSLIDKVEDYTGQKLDDLRLHLQALFASSDTEQITLDEKIVYEYDSSEAGTILAQDPAPDTPITNPIKLKVIVSKGPEHEKAKVPNLIGLTVNEVLTQMARSKLIYEFSSRPAEPGEIPGTIITQGISENTYVSTYTRVPAVFVYPAKQEFNKVYGIFTENLPVYPYALQVKLDALTPDGERFNVVTMMHLGGMITIPYVLPPKTELILSIYDKEALRRTVR